MDFNNTNRGSLWPNKKATTATAPGETGSLDIDGIDCFISAWTDDPESPTSRSLSVSPKDDPKDDRRRFSGALDKVDPINERAPTMRGYLWLEGDDLIALAGWNRVTADGRSWVSISAEAWRDTDPRPPKPGAASSSSDGKISSLTAPTAAPDPFAPAEEVHPADIKDEDDDLPF